MNRLGLKITCLVVSVIIWVQVASTSVVEQTTNLPLRIFGLGEGLTTAGSKIPKEIKVRVRASKLTLISHNYFNEYLGEVVVNLSGRVAGPPFVYEINEAHVNSDLDVISINPQVQLSLQVDDLITRNLPVQLLTKGELPANMDFLAEPRVQPDSVAVTGPKRGFSEYSVLLTDPVDLSQLNSAQTIPLVVTQVADLLEVSEQQLSVFFPVAQLEDRTLANVPVVALVDVGTPDVAISPPVIDVMVRGVADSVQALTESRFLVTVSVGARQEGIYVLAPEVDPPDWLTVIGLDPPTLQVIVGNPDINDGAQVQQEVEATVDGLE